MTLRSDARTLTRRTLLASGGSFLAACAAAPISNPDPTPQMAFAGPTFIEGYGPIFDAGYTLPAIPEQYTQGVNRRMTGIYIGEQPRGSIDVDPYAKFLYFIPEFGETIRYPVGLGRAGRSFAGDGLMQLKRKWPSWTPTENMIRTEPEVYAAFRRGIPGGLRNPLGSRALYLYKDGRDTYYRIHGTNDMSSIGNSGSAGCIRMFNQDVIDLYERVPLGTPIHVRSEAESLRVDPENYNRGIEMPAVIVDPEDVYGEAARAADRAPDFDAVAPPGIHASPGTPVASTVSAPSTLAPYTPTDLG